MTGTLIPMGWGLHEWEAIVWKDNFRYNWKLEGRVLRPSIKKKKNRLLSTLFFTQGKKKLTPKATPAGTKTVNQGFSPGLCDNQVQHIPELCLFQTLGNCTRWGESEEEFCFAWPPLGTGIHIPLEFETLSVHALIFQTPTFPGHPRLSSALFS